MWEFFLNQNIINLYKLMVMGLDKTKNLGNRKTERKNLRRIDFSIQCIEYNEETIRIIDQ